MPADLRAGYFFHDYNAKLNYDFGDKNKLFLSGYFGKDKFSSKIKSGTSSTTNFTLGWGNATATARWNHLYNPKLFSNTSVIFSNYDFRTNVKFEESNFNFALSYLTGIQDYGLKHDMDYLPNINHHIKMGLMSTNHMFTTQSVTVKVASSTSSDNTDKVEKSYGIESAAYIEDDYKILPSLKINPGLRLTHFIIKEKSYYKFEPRFSASYSLKEDLAIKASYADMNQYIHLISNTGIGLPTDLWVPATSKLGPQNSKQWAAGIAKDYLKQNIAVSIEGYYKTMKDVLAFKEGASFLETNGSSAQTQSTGYRWEQNVTSGKGWSYGTELLVQRKHGKLSGWVGYTLSWTYLQFDSLNFGKKFFPKYDRRHDISVVGIYKIRKENTDNDQDGITLSATWVYGTGNAITLGTAQYDAFTHQLGGVSFVQGGNTSSVSDFGEKNSFRMASYHRFDIGVQFHKTKKHCIRTLEIGVYNVYNRKNPFFYFTTEDASGKSILKQLSLFPIIPSISYNFKFVKTTAKKIEKITYE
jgi:outer membrane receptor for ferrienterochelin and colicin